MFRAAHRLIPDMRVDDYPSISGEVVYLLLHDPVYRHIHMLKVLSISDVVSLWLSHLLPQACMTLLDTI